MPRNTSRAGQRVDQIRVSDEPHDLYRTDGTPVLQSSKRGQVVEKSVYSYTVMCPECRVDARYDQASEPICPVCGLICDGEQGEEVARTERLQIDAKAAGRVPSDTKAHS